MDDNSKSLAIRFCSLISGCHAVYQIQIIRLGETLLDAGAGKKSWKERWFRLEAELDRGKDGPDFMIGSSSKGKQKRRESKAVIFWV